MENEKPFSKLAEIYDELMEEDFYEKMLRYLEEGFERYSIMPGKVLDLACGTGRFSLHLATKGWSVTGIDISPQMLALARQHSEESGLPIRFILGNMVELKTDEVYDLVTCFYDSVNYILDEDRLLRLFKRVQKTLAAVGCFIFDLNTLHGLKEYWNTGMRRRIFSKGHSLWMTCWNEDTQINTLKLVASFREGDGSFKRLTEVHHERGYTNDTVNRLLKKAGFHSVDMFECFSFDPDDGEAGKIMVIAR